MPVLPQNLSPTNLVGAGLLLAAGAYCVFAALRSQVPWARWRVAAMLACRLALLAGVAAWWLELRLDYRYASPRVEMVVVADRSASIGPTGRADVDRWLARTHDAFDGKDDRWLGVLEIGKADPAASPVAEALDAALGILPGRGEQRILLLSDGRATAGDPLAVAEKIRARGVRLLAVPEEPLAGESLLAELIVPPACWRNVPVPVEVVLVSAAGQQCRLTLSVDGQAGEPRDVHLPAGTSSVAMSAKLPADGVHRIDVQAAFEHDRLAWNNAASALVDVPLAPRVIVVSDPPAAAGALAAVLASAGLETRVTASQNLPDQFACDCIVLANVSAEAMTAPRLAAIERYVRAGGSVVMTGGAKAFAAGGYVGSPLEPAFPVLLLPKKEQPPYALAVVMDNSWSMNEGLTASVGKIDLAKEIALAAIDGLHRGDWLAFVSFDSDYHTIIPPTKVADLKPLEYEVTRIGAFGMTNILGGMQEGAKFLHEMDAPYRHMILISDGKETETGTDYSRLLALLARDKVTLTTIGVGLGPNDKLLNTLAFAGKGRYLHAKSIQEVPAVVLQEAKSLEDQLLVPVPLPPRKVEDDPALAGLDMAVMPKLLGYNRSRARPHAWTPLVISGRGEPLLARMRYGRGQSLAVLSSAGGAWAKQWVDTAPEQYAAFWRQAVVSVLAPPHRPLEGPVSYDADGAATWDLSAAATAASGAAEGGAAGNVRCELTRLDGGPPAAKQAGKQVTAPAACGSMRLETAGAEAVLATVKGKANWAAAWSRAYGREFADPAAGTAAMRDLCRAAGGVYAPEPDEPLAPGRASVRAQVQPETWLILAALMLVIELLVRRLPALTAALGGLLASRERENRR